MNTEKQRNFFQLVTEGEVRLIVQVGLEDGKGSCDGPCMQPLRDSQQADIECPQYYSFKEEHSASNLNQCGYTLFPGRPGKWETLHGLYEVPQQSSCETMQEVIKL